VIVAAVPASAGIVTVAPPLEVSVPLALSGVGVALGAGVGVAVVPLVDGRVVEGPHDTATTSAAATNAKRPESRIFKEISSVGLRECARHP
jgi:hypothetical protein